MTTNYVLDTEAPLTQVLQDGPNTYLYGDQRIAQYTSSGPEYFLTDGLGSVRQIVDSNGSVILAKNYQPYGEESSSVGSASSRFGFTGEAEDPGGLLYLRAREYSTQTGRFLTQDTWLGEEVRPLSLNRWIYAEDNSINYSDPTGYSKCAIYADAGCQILGQRLHDKASSIKIAVQDGGLLPVEGLASLADFATKDLFQYDLADVMWGMTGVLSGIDTTQNMAIWLAVAFYPKVDSPYFVGQDWLPYQQYYPEKPEGEHIYSKRGDWKSIYWDDTANQAFHFWYYAAVTYYDGASWAYLADSVHDPYQNGETKWDISEEDHNLALKGIELVQTPNR